MSQDKFHHVFTIIDNMVDTAVSDVVEDGESISCGKGCTHCCYLLVEVCWEEALQLARWILRKPEIMRDRIKHKVLDAAERADRFFNSNPQSAKYSKPWDHETELPDWLYDQYFYGASRPCPFLDNDCCIAYEARPTTCRLHMVSSPPQLCSRQVRETDDFEIPDRIEDLKEESGPVVSAMAKDGRWGHMSIMIREALKELEA